MLFTLPLGAFAASNVTTNIAISPGTIAPGDPATLTITVVNDNSAAATIASINQALPSGLIVQSFDGTTCTGGTGGTPGATSFTFGGGTVPGIAPPSTSAGTCTITYTITSDAAAPAATPLDVALLGANVQTSAGPSDNDAHQPLTVLSLLPLGGSKGFTPSTVAPNGTSVLKITVNNPNSFDMPGTQMSDDLSTMGAGVTIATSPAPTATGCGALSAPVINGMVVSLGSSGIDLAPNTTCTITLTVNAPAGTGVYANTIPAGTITSTRGPVATDPSAHSANLTVQVPAGGGKSFTADGNVSSTTVVSGGNPVQLEITITNTLATNIVGDLTLNDVFPTDGTPTYAGGLPAVVLSIPGGGSAADIVRTDGCNFSAASKAALVAGSGSISLSGGSLAAGATCVVSFWVEANQDPGFVSALNAAGGSTTITNTIPVGGVSSASTGFVNGQPLTGSIVVRTTGPGAVHYNLPVDKLLDIDGAAGGETASLKAVIPSAPATTPVGYVRLYFANTLEFSDLVMTSIEDDVGTFTNSSGLPLTVKPGDPVTVGQSQGDANACAGLSVANATADNSTFKATFTGTIPATTPSTPSNMNQCWVSFPVYLDPSGSAATWPGDYNNNVGIHKALGTVPTFNTDGTSAAAENDAASRTTTLSVQAGVDINKVFANTVLGPGGTTTLSITLTNRAIGTAVSGGTLVDALPSGMTVAATPNFTTDCGASFAGTTSITFGNISVPAATGTAPSAVVPGTCTLNIDVTVAGNVPASFPNSILANALAGGGVTNPLPSNTATVSMSNLAISASKSFNLASVYAGQSARMTIHISNPNNINLTQVQVIDPLPAGMVFAPTPNVAVTCSGSNVAGAVTTSGTTLSGTGFTLVPGPVTAGCDISVDVQLNSGGTATNTIPVGTLPQTTNTGLTSREGAINTGPISATLISVASTAVSKGIQPAAVIVGQPATVTVRVSNSTNGTVGPIGVLDQINPSAGYPAGVIPAAPTYVAPPGATWQIVGGTVALSTTTGGTDGAGAGCAMGADTTTAGGANDQTQINGVIVPPNTFCDVTFQVKASAEGLYRNAILQENVTPAANGPNVCYPDSGGTRPTPCFVSADLSVGPAGSLSVTKTISDPGAAVTAPNPALAGWIFTVTSSNGCDLTGLTTSATTTDTGVVNFPMLPVYTDATQTTQCQYSVAESGGSPNYSLDPASSLTDVILTGGSATSVTANNIRATGSLTVTKTVTVFPATAAVSVSGTFNVDIDCGADGTYGPLAIAVTNNTGSATQTGLPVGATCTISEDTSSLPAAPANFTWGAAPTPSYTQPAGAIAATTPQTAAVTNTLTQLTSELTITKTISGGPAAGVTNASFTFIATCSGVAGSPFTGTVTVASGTSGTGMIAGIPAGSVCTVAETAPPAASAPASYSWGVTPTAQSITTVATAGANALTFTNTLTAQAVAPVPAPALREWMMVLLGLALAALSAHKVAKQR